ncbi:GGDEF domain-containing protein [Oryzisolibacter sp. LB2S]|uniref:GGDEF domain-containing protein n=1 Tax=Alicycliphilus soli TaxID=3228789 RepID=UPI00345A2A80
MARQRYGLGRAWHALWLALCCAALPPAQACDGARNIRLREPVRLSAQERAEVRTLAPLRVLAVDAPPMARYEPEQQTFSGIGVDVWCFIARELGLRYEILSARDTSLADKLRQVQQGEADVFLPLSHQSERARLGLFTQPYYDSYYAVIARKGRHFPVHGLDDLAPYYVGMVKGVALVPRVQAVVDPSRLTLFDQTSSDGLFQAVRRGAVDLAVYSEDIFEEKRYTHEYFDLQVVHTLRDDPRQYRFYFSPSPQHERLVALMDRYLAVMDISASVTAHTRGERQFVERYVAERSQRAALNTAGAAAALLVVVLGLAFVRYRRMALQLAASNRQILRQKQALQAANEELQQLSLSDALTGLANRRAFDQTLQQELVRQQRSGTPLSLLLVDVDHFKSVNDHYGHATGDDYLRAIAQVLRKTLQRCTDLAARHGGEEFVCLLPDTGAAQAQALAERIRVSVERLGLPNALAGQRSLTVSVGVATALPASDVSAQRLLHEADMRLYAAKRAGRNCVHASVAHVKHADTSGQANIKPL